MQLPQPLWTRIMSSVAQTPEPTQRDARQSNRIRQSACLPLAPLRDGKIGTVTTVLARNLSPTGLSFLSSTELLAEQEFLIWLSIGENKSVAVLCRVVWRDVLSRTSSLVGAVFVRAATDAESAHNVPAPTAAPAGAAPESAAVAVSEM
jgi:hypothetical protein